jgi:uncharacterized protein (TIGR03083 family)
MKKQQVLTKLDRAWTEFSETFQGLSPAQMEAPGVMENWSVKDLIAHVATWENEALTHLPHILEGVRPPRYADAYGGLDAFNALMTEKKRSLPLIEVLEQFEATHRKLVAYLATAPEEQFATETRFRRRLRLDTYSHYPLHTRAIQAWRERAG